MRALTDEISGRDVKMATFISVGRAISDVCGDSGDCSCVAMAVVERRIFYADMQWVRFNIDKDILHKTDTLEVAAAFGLIRPAKGAR